MAYKRQYNVTFMLQYYKHPQNIQQITKRLYACTKVRALRP